MGVFYEAPFEIGERKRIMVCVCILGLCFALVVFFVSAFSYFGCDKRKPKMSRDIAAEMWRKSVIFMWKFSVRV